MIQYMMCRMSIPAWVCVALLSSPAWGQEKQPLNASGEGMKSRWVQQNVIDVDDVPGHQLRNYEIHRTFSSSGQPVVDGERVIEGWVRGYSNYTNGIGPVWSYTTWITDKGSKIFIESIGTSESKPTETGSKRGTYHGTSRIVGGTGRFANLRGLFVDVSKFDTDPKVGYSTADSHGDYWFEK
jgi:hypothetical protein